MYQIGSWRGSSQYFEIPCRSRPSRLPQMIPHGQHGNTYQSFFLLAFITSIDASLTALLLYPKTIYGPRMGNPIIGSLYHMSLTRSWYVLLATINKTNTEVSIVAFFGFTNDGCRINTDKGTIVDFTDDMIEIVVKINSGGDIDSYPTRH